MRISKPANDLTAADIELALHRIVDVDHLAFELAKKITCWSSVFEHLKLLFKRFSESEYLFDCSHCGKQQGISLWLDAYAYPQFHCSCGVQKQGNSYLDLICLLLQTPRRIAISRINDHLRPKKARKTFVRKPTLPGLYPLTTG